MLLVENAATDGRFLTLAIRDDCKVILGSAPMDGRFLIFAVTNDRTNNGAHDWNRTSDLFLTKEVLYRLSYMSVCLPVAETVINGAGDGNRTRTISLEG
jgi:hypothetical protein